MDALFGKPSSSARAPYVCFGAASMIGCSRGSGSKATFPFALDRTASHISPAEAEMPERRKVRLDPSASPGREDNCEKHCTTFRREMHARRVSGLTGHT